VNQVRNCKPAATRPRQIVTAKWGTVRTERNPQREQVVAEMKEFIRRTPGDADKGKCLQASLCQLPQNLRRRNDVRPDLTRTAQRFQSLLSNVFDPSLVIGAAYQAR